MREGGFQVKWYPTKLRKQMKLTIKAGQLTVTQSKGVPKWEGPDWEHWGHTIPWVVSTEYLCEFDNRVNSRAS